jgi:hypothetical protein
MLAAIGRFNKIFKYFPIRGACGRDIGLILHKINRVYTPEEYCKLIEQSSRKGKFSVTMCNNFSTEYKHWWPKFYKKNTMSVQYYSEAVPRIQKVNSSISQYCMCEYSSQRPEVITTDFADGFVTNNFKLLSVPNKILDLPNEKSFPNGMCPINFKKMDGIKQIIKYIDHDHQDFWIFILAWETTSKEDQDK